MQKTFKLSTLAALLLCSSLAFAQQYQDEASHTGDNVNNGDSSVSQDMDNSRTEANQQGVASNSNASGNHLGNDVDVRAPIDQNVASNISGGNVTGGNTNGTINGGSDDAVSNSMGNRTDIGDLSNRSGDVSSANTNLVGSASQSGAASNASNGDQTTMVGNANQVGNTNTVGNASSNTGTNTGLNSSVNDVRGTNTSNVGNTSANTGTNTSANSNRGGDQSLRGGDQTSVQGQAQNASTKSGVSKSGNSQTAVDASDRSTNTYTSRTTVWAPVVHGPAAAPLAAANLVVVPGKCGPRVNIIKTDVTGKRFGVWGGQDDVAQGLNYDMESATDASGNPEPFKRVGDYLLGHEVVIQSAVVGTSSGGSFSLGGYGKNGEGAQGGGAASGGLQQIVSKILVRDCIMAVEKMSEAAAAQ
jgi:hypothetical protein